MNQAARAYFQTSVTTTTPGSLVVMLYDGAIKFLQQAKKKMAEKDYAQKGILISKALDIIAELDGSLNLERGGDVAENLHKMYFFCSTQLLKANLQMDQELIDKVIDVLKGVRSAFAEIVVQSPEVAKTTSLGASAYR
ncbi:MAG: flagellar export chaperone FliS [Deltaproteobacteria bacterium]|nr:flagellar export chaperone FliS [Deltaproteobacteria bacterium]